MRKVFEFKSSSRELERNNNRTTSGTNPRHSRRRLFRQPKSCPQFTNPVSPNTSSSSGQLYYLRRRPDLLSIDTLLTRVQLFQGNDFVYLNYAVSVESEFFTPYSFQEVEYSRVDRHKYFTISRHGFTVWSRTECSFTPIDIWTADYRKYCSVFKIKVFATYRLWKTFKKWSKLIRRQKYLRNKNSLAALLFLAQPKLPDATVQFHRASQNIQAVQLFQVDLGSVWDLKELMEHQTAVYLRSSAAIEEFYNQVSASIDVAATSLLKSKGFPIEDCEFSVSPMKFTDRLKKRRTCSLICRYLRYLDYMTMNLLYELVLQGSQSFLNLIEQCNSSDATRALLSIKISLTDQEMSINPPQDQVVDSLKEIIDQSLQVVKVKRFEENSRFLKFTQPIIGGRKEILKKMDTILDIEKYFCVDNRLTSNRSRIVSLVTDSFGSLNHYLDRFKSYLLMYSMDLQTNSSDLEKFHNVQELRRFCERYTGQMADIGGIEPFKHFGIFELDQRCFNEVMTPLYERLYGKICTHLPSLVSQLLNETNEICQEIMGTLLTPPEGTVGFVAYIYFIDRCESVFMEVTDKLTTVDELLQLISIYGIEAGQDLWKRYQTVSEFLVNCKDAHSKKLNQKGNFVEKLSANIDKDVYQVYTEVSELKAEATKDWILSEDSQPAIVKETLSNALDQLQMANEKLVQLQSYCEAMDLELIDLSIFVEVQMDARVRLNLWESLEEWTNSIQEWYTQHFNQLNIEHMRAINKKILENCLVFSNALPENAISQKLEKSVELFRGKIDIISQLRNETLKERHWSAIEDLVSREIVDNDSITIGDFEEVGVFEEKIAQKLFEISAQARAEQLLDEELSRIECFWMEYHLKLIPYRYHRNIFVLTDIEEVALCLDDSFVKMTVIRSSQYVEPIRERVEKWIIHLKVSTETLSEWSACQSSWIRLEYLFSLPGIEFKIPDELLLFNDIHSAWRDTLCEAHENPLALVALLRPGRLQTFHECNMKIKDLSDRMCNFLNTRRLNFPRLYFLSDFELMTILTEEPKNVEQVGRFMPKIFDSIFKLIVKRTDIACLLEPIYTITHMISDMGHAVPLVDVVKIDGSTDQWLKVLEIEMTNTVRKALQQAYNSFDSEKVIEWEEDKLPQVNLVITRLKLFEMVEEYLNNLDTKVEGEIDCFVKDLKQKVLSHPKGRNSSILTSLFCNVMYYKDLLERIKSKSIDVTDFCRIWRYKWQNKAPVLTLDGFDMPYFNEFISRGEDFWFSEATEQTFWHFQRTIKAGLNCLLSGPKAVGKTASIRMFAKLTAKFTITFECFSRNANYEDFKRVLFGIVQTGCWCILKNLDQVDNEILSVIGDQLMLIKEAKWSNRRDITLTGERIKFNLWSQFFMISNQPEELPKSLKIYLRSITVVLPDLRVLRNLKLELERSVEEENSKNVIGKDFERHVLVNIITIVHGPPGSGKTRTWMNYVKNYNASHADKMEFIQMFINSLPVEQLFGHYHSSGRWIDGFFEKTFHKFYKANPINGRLLIILDGDLKDDWMNILRGINERRRFITLPNLALLRIPERVSIVIECGASIVKDLIQQCKFIHAIKCNSPMVKLASTYFEELLPVEVPDQPTISHLNGLFEKYFPSLSEFITKTESFSYQTVNVKIKFLVGSIADLIREDITLETIERVFIFSILWTLGGALTYSEKVQFEDTLRESIPPELLPDESLWDVYYCPESMSFCPFTNLMPDFKVNPLNISLDLTLPTLESTRLAYVFKVFGKRNPILLVDPSRDLSIELGKAIERYDQELQVRISQIFLGISKSSDTVQNELERVLIPRRKQSIGPVIKSRHIYILGDICQADSNEDVSEFLRQLIEIRGYYDRETWNLIKLLDVCFVGVTTRVADSHKRLAEQCFIVAPVSSPCDYFSQFWGPVLEKLASDVEAKVQDVVLKLISVPKKLWKCLEKRRSKSLLFDMKRILVGVLQPKTISSLNSFESINRLFQYEINRVLGDSNHVLAEQLEIFNATKSLCDEAFSCSVELENSLVFGDFAPNNSSQGIYEEIPDQEKLKVILVEHLNRFNKNFGTKHDLFWHNHLLINLSRVCGLIRMPHFHGCIIGGVSKKSICKLAAFINGYRAVECVGIRMLETEINNLVENRTSGRILLLLSNYDEMECLQAIVEILDNAKPSFMGHITGGYNSLRSRINILLLYDSEAMANSVFLRFPTLKRFCQRYYYPSWSSEEYKFIALTTFDRLKLLPQESRSALADLAVQIHGTFDVPDNCTKFSRKFVHLVEIYDKLWKTEKSGLEDKLMKIRSCKKKLSEIKEKMASEDLKKFLPLLEDRKSTLKEMRFKLDHMVTNCEEVRAQVVLDESSVKIQTASTAEITDDVNKDLEIAMPALRAAQDQIKSLSKGDWNELKGQNNPVKLVIFVHEAVCILFKLKPDWPTAKALINDPNILTKILDFDKENISEMVIKKIKAYIDSKDFDPAKIEKVSKVSKCLCLWVKAIDQFAKVFKIVEPKVRKQQNAESTMRECVTDLRRKQQDLADAESKIQILRDKIEEYNSSFQVLQENVDLINQRLSRANRVTTALADEDLAWTLEIEHIECRLENLATDVLFTCAAIVYLGEFTESDRKKLVKQWTKMGAELNLNISKGFELRKLLVDDLSVLNWHSMGLPSDAISLENALIIRNSLRFPMIIDRHERLTSWLLCLEPNMRVLHHSQRDFEDLLKASLNTGERVLIMEIYNPVNALLVDILHGTVVERSGSSFLQLKSCELPVNPQFFLHLVTKGEIGEFDEKFLNNINIIDCQVSDKGNEEQILAAISEVELHAMRAQAEEVQKKIEEDCLRMKDLQETIVTFLHEAKVNILDDAELVASIYETKETYSIVVDRLADTRESEKVLLGIKEKYQPIAMFGTRLLKVVNELKALDPLYGIPMTTFVDCFSRCVVKLDGDNVVPEVNQARVMDIIKKSIREVFAVIQPRLRREDQVCFGIRILELLKGSAVPMHEEFDVNCLEVELGLNFWSNGDISRSFGGQMNPIIFIPKDESLEELLWDLGQIEEQTVKFIAVGEGNENIVLHLLTEGCAQGHAVVLQNVSLNGNIARHVEEQFAEEPLSEDYRLIIVAEDSREIPKSILYKSSVFAYYGRRASEEKIPYDVLKSRLNDLRKISGGIVSEEELI